TLTVLRTQDLPHSIGLLYEELTMHLGFNRSSDEYKVMGLASYGSPHFLDAFRTILQTVDGTFTTQRPVAWETFCPERRSNGEFLTVHADLAASVQRRLEEAVLELARWL